MCSEMRTKLLPKVTIGAALVLVLAGCGAQARVGGSDATESVGSGAMESTGSADTASVHASQRPEDDPANLIPAHSYELEGSHEVFSFRMSSRAVS